MSGAAAAASPKLSPLSADLLSADSEPVTFSGGSIFGAFGKSASFKAPLKIQIVSFTREDEGHVNYHIMVI
jgi:hypothetical protein